MGAVAILDDANAPARRGTASRGILTDPRGVCLSVVVFSVLMPR